MDQRRFLKAIGQRVRAVRKTRNISQERLAELASLHPTYISDIENGKVNASISSYFVIARALNIPLSELVNLPSGKADRGVENEIAEVTGILRGLSRKNQAVFLSAAKGMLKGIEAKAIASP